MTGRRQRGYTLAELMIAVAIIGILASVAIPLYQEHIITTQREAVVAKVELFRAFEENARIDSGAYDAGFYTPGGTNDFADIGYRVPNDRDGISFTVAACGTTVGQTIDACYRVDARTSDGRIAGRWQNGVWTWTL